jgi:hypothetical protein
MSISTMSSATAERNRYLIRGEPLERVGHYGFCAAFVDAFQRLCFDRPGGHVELDC